MKQNEMENLLSGEKMDGGVMHEISVEALSDEELEKVSGGYDPNYFNKEDCEKRLTWDLTKCAFCTRCKVMYGSQMVDGIMCNTVHYFCRVTDGRAVLMFSHWSLPTGETVKTKVYDNN